MPTAAVVVKVVSPGDATQGKLTFSIARGVLEVWVLDPLARTVQIRRRRDQGWRIEGSSVLGSRRT